MSGYGWGAVLNEHLEPREFWSKEDEQKHIIWKELKVVRFLPESFLPKPAGRDVLMHEDNQAVGHILKIMTSRSHVMMEELRRLLCLLDTNNINLMACNISSTTNNV
jgi:DNA-directed RNA polymerase subunit H (RpoH/RPB5)